MRFVKLNGKNSFARGLALGKLIKDACAYNLSFLKQRLTDVGLSLDYGLRLASENERVIAKCFPEVLEEIRGVAEGARLPYNHVLLETAFPFTAKSSTNCTVVSAFGPATTDTRSLVGRNYDFLLDFKKCNRLQIVINENKQLSFVGGTVTILGVEEGLNSAGLFIGDAGWEPKMLPSSRGLSSRQVMQLVLENCVCVDSAIDFIFQIPKFANNAGTCYLLADRREAVVIEMGLTKSCLRKPEGGVLVGSNVFLTSVADEIKPPEPPAFIRYEFAKKCLQKDMGKIDKGFMKELLSDHHIPICSHNEINTLRSMIAKTSERKVLVADGYPCTSEFDEILVPT